MNEKIRNSNFELLKVILTIMILVLHYCNGYIGGALSNIPVGTVNYHLIHIAESLCIASVNTFIVITGYFMCRKNEIRISKILKILYLTLVYGVLIFFGWFIISHPQINTETIKLSVASISNRWFVIIYCILFLLIPYINKVVQSINKRQFQILLVILLFFFYIWPTFFTNITVKDNGYGITNFLTLYLTGGYINLHCSGFKSVSKSTLVFVLCSAATYFFSLFSENAFYYNSVFNLIGAVALFEIFHGLTVKNSKRINFLATYAFSTYIIHENPLISKWLYRDVFQTSNYWTSQYLILNLIITTIGIYALCVLIEFIRRYVMKKADRLIEKTEYTLKV